VNVILNFTPDGVAATNSVPLKNIAWISAGVSLGAAAAGAGGSMEARAIPAIHSRMAISPEQTNHILHDHHYI
jgi:hypothetical protein